jgi:hypothetical protein
MVLNNTIGFDWGQFGKAPVISKMDPTFPYQENIKKEAGAIPASLSQWFYRTIFLGE